MNPAAADAKAPEEEDAAQTEGEGEAPPEAPTPPEPPRHKAKYGEAPTKECTALGSRSTKGGLNPAYARELLVVDRGGGLTNMQRDTTGWEDIQDDLDKEAARVGFELGVGPEAVDLEVPLSVLDASGIRAATAIANFRHRFLEVDLPGAFENFALATRTCVPPETASLKYRRLSEVSEGAERAAQWTTKKEGKPYRAVGEVRGTFGAGVDRVVVVALEKRIDLSDLAEDDEKKYAEFMCEADFAIAMKGDRVHGDLAVARPIGAAAQRACAKDMMLSMDELGLAGVSDLDGDGVEELLWTYNYFPSPREQALVLTGFSEGKFRRWKLGEHSYAGSEVFVNPQECGRSKTERGASKQGATPCSMPED